jgi:hypothetical protein
MSVIIASAGISTRIEGFSLAPIATTERDNICALQKRKAAFDAPPIR